MGVGARIRPRREDDLDVLLPLLRRLHEDVGYPVRPAAVSAAWVATDDELGGWVAVDADGRVLGHVALQPAHGPSTPLWCAATGRDEDGLAVVARLFTDRTVRGAGTALLAHACERAAALGRVPVLEVDGRSAAHRLYLRHGWREVGRVVQTWGHRTVETPVLVGPGVSPAAGPGTPPR